VAIVSMDRVPRHNALSSELTRELADAIATAGADERRRVLVLASSARHFSVGADLKERSVMDDAGLMAARATSRHLTRTLLRSPLPVIAAVHGFALGGGLELALACDLIVAAPSAVFGLPEARIGIIPGGGGSQLLARRVGWGAATEMVLTARRVCADEAREMGLVDRPVCREPVEDAAIRLAAEIASCNPNSISLIRESMYAGAGLGIDAALQIEDDAWRTAAVSDGYREGLSSFAEKRAPHWEGS
jgi:enoyl-CoA hydratase/carnithine racemase